MKKWKKKLLDMEVSEMELAHAKNNSHELFKRVKKLAKERDKTQLAARNKEGILKTAPTEVMKCWEEHFAIHLNTEFPKDNSVLETIPDPSSAEYVSRPFSIIEVEKAIQALTKSLKDNV